MPTKIQGGLGIDKIQDGTVGMSDVDTELYGKITALTTINLGEAKTASGTVVDFDVPEGVKRVTVMFDGVSTNGTSNPMIQIGDLEGLETTGYKSSAQTISLVALFTTGFGVGASTAATSVFSGQAILSKCTLDMWVMLSTVGYSNAAGAAMAGGSKSLSGPLDRIRITTVNGTDLFDAGTINISWEF